MTSKIKVLAGATALTLMMGTAANATTLSITFENNNGFGFLTTPVYAGFHDGGFDAFDAGMTASPGVAQAAELPIPPNLDGLGNLIAGERRDNQDGDGVDSQGTFIANGGPIADGTSATIEIEIENPEVNQFLTLLAMVVPSNDTFFGNDNPELWRLFDDDGGLILTSFDITAGMIYDAGSEINEFSTSTQADIVASNEENGVITSIFETDGDGDNGFQNLSQLFGLGDVDDIQRDTVFFSVSIADVTPIPLPASAPMLLAGLGWLGWRARHSRTTA